MALGWLAKPGDSDDTRLLRQKLVPFVASTGEEKELIEQAGNAGARMAGQPARHQLRRCWSRCFESLLNSATATCSIRFERRPFRSAIIMLREVLLEALGSFRNPELARASLDLLLSKDFDLRESFYPLLFGPLSYADTRDVPFEFVKQHLDALLKRLPREVGEDYAAMLPAVGGSFCDAKRRDELDSFFRRSREGLHRRPPDVGADAGRNRPVHRRAQEPDARADGLPESILNRARF